MNHRISVLIIIFLVNFLGIACVTNEEGRKTLNLISDSQMNQLGAQSFQELKQQEQLSQNKEAAETVRRIGQRIAEASGEKFDWEFHLFASETVNAFCLPGGKVGVYEGILPIAENEAGLAAIIGHEVAHAVLKHGAERLSQGLVLQAGMTATDVVLGDNQFRTPIMAAIGLGSQIGVLLPYSRLHESEADLKGLEYLAKAGYDPEEAPKLWERMAKLNENRSPEFLATHPDPEKRAKALRAEISKVKAEYAKSTKQTNRKIPF